MGLRLIDPYLKVSHFIQDYIHINISADLRENISDNLLQIDDGISIQQLDPGMDDITVMGMVAKIQCCQYLPHIASIALAGTQSP